MILSLSERSGAILRRKKHGMTSPVTVPRKAFPASESFVYVVKSMPIRYVEHMQNDLNRLFDIRQDDKGLRGFFRNHAKLLRSSELALSVGCIVGAAFGGGDRQIVLIVLSAAIIFAVAGILASNLQKKTAYAASAAVTAAIVAFGFYLDLHSANKTTSSAGGLIEITSLPPKENIKGNYDFILIMKNIGPTKVINFEYVQGTITSLHILSQVEEDKFFSKTQNDFLKQMKNRDNSRIYNGIAPLDAMLSINPRPVITKEMMSEIISEKIYVYNYVIYAYSDEVNSSVFYGKYCRRFVPEHSLSVPCATPTFAKTLLK